MSELYLRFLDKVITPALLLLSIYLLLRGHNEPGGGFIAGLTAAAAVQLQLLSRGDTYVRTQLGIYLHPLTGLGLLLALVAAIIGLTTGEFFKGVWVYLNIGLLEIELGTPLLFDVGVYLVVVSVLASFMIGLSRNETRVQK
jgi:multicomponent Na+:H+ antiporter subunit B